MMDSRVFRLFAYYRAHEIPMSFSTCWDEGAANVYAFERVIFGWVYSVEYFRGLLEGMPCYMGCNIYKSIGV